MNIRTPLTALAFCLASTVTFAATPTAPPANPSVNAASTSASGAHCSKGYVLQHNKCVAKDKTKSKN